MNIDSKYSDCHYENMGPTSPHNMGILQMDRMVYVPPKKPAEIKSWPKDTINET